MNLETVFISQIANQHYKTTNNNKTRNMNLNSVLIIGATGRTGNCLLKRLAKGHTGEQSNAPSIFAMCRDPSKLSGDARVCCAGIIKGNTRDVKDIEKALISSKAELVIIAVGNGDNVKKNDIWAASARALVAVLTKYCNVRAVVMSSIGAGGSKIKAGFGIGTLIGFHLRHVLNDHDGQEVEFLSVMKGRTFIVRPTGLTEGKAAGKVVPFGDSQKCPNLETDRQDLANWIATEIIFNRNGATQFGKQVNIASQK
jgi:putative NADH-flavin reductase